MSKTDDIYHWIQENGYPLEMRVAQKIREHELLYLTQSHFLADTVTGKMRELDILASWGFVGPDFEESEAQHVITDLIVECKDTKHSWVAFKDIRSEFNEIPRTVLALNAIPSKLPENPEPDGWEHQLYPTDDNTPRFLAGTYNPCYAIKQKSLGQKKAENSDPAYNAVCKIGEAAADLAKQQRSGFYRCIPAIVTTAELFECTLQESGEIRVDEVERTSVLLSTLRYPESIEVHILREQALPEFAEEINEVAVRLAEEPEHRNRD